MNRFAALLTAAVIGLAAVLPAQARQLGDAEAQKMAKTVEIYLGMIKRSEMDRVVTAIPPRVLNVFAGQAGIEAKELVPTLAEQMKAMLKDHKFYDFTFEKTGLEAHDAVLPDGTAVTWVLVPTAFTSESAAGKFRNEQPLLVLSEGGKWYMMRIEGAAQQQLVSFAYPFLAEVEFPASRSTPLN